MIQNICGINLYVVLTGLFFVNLVTQASASLRPGLYYIGLSGLRTL
jgi:hypothetical protein